jgi:hypothetical protein
METKYATSYRLSTEARRLLVVLAQQWGISQTSVIEIALRDIAKRERVSPLKETVETGEHV